MTTVRIYHCIKKTRRRPPGEWVDEAICPTVDPELFFPVPTKKGRYGAEAHQTIKAAKAICAQCPVIGQCLAYALNNDIRFGIWGGMSERDREKLTGKRRDWIR
jgi:WhiB family redox-sensing transcriptional regulator